jgi:hypothetical protein
MQLNCTHLQPVHNRLASIQQRLQGVLRYSQLQLLLLPWSLRTVLIIASKPYSFYRWGRLRFM